MTVTDEHMATTNLVPTPGAPCIIPHFPIGHSVISYTKALKLILTPLVFSLLRVKKATRLTPATPHVIVN